MRPADYLDDDVSALQQHCLLLHQLQRVEQEQEQLGVLHVQVCAAGEGRYSSERVEQEQEQLGVLHV